MFTLTYTLNRQDYLDFNRHSLFGTRTGRRTVLITRVVMALAILFLLAVVFAGQGSSGWLRTFQWCLAVGVAALAFFLFKPLMLAINKRNIKRLERAGRLVYDKPITLRFEDDAFYEQSEDGEARLAYTLIERVEAGETAIYLYQGANQARPVPNRAFADEAERQAFEAFIRARSGGAGAGVAAP